jgi:hypothetical protein
MSYIKLQNILKIKERVRMTNILNHDLVEVVKRKSRNQIGNLESKTYLEGGSKYDRIKKFYEQIS